MQIYFNICKNTKAWLRYQGVTFWIPAPAEVPYEFVSVHPFVCLSVCSSVHSVRCQHWLVIFF